MSCSCAIYGFDHYCSDCYNFYMTGSFMGCFKGGQGSAVAYVEQCGTRSPPLLQSLQPKSGSTHREQALHIQLAMEIIYSCCVQRHSSVHLLSPTLSLSLSLSLIFCIEYRTVIFKPFHTRMEIDTHTGYMYSHKKKLGMKK